MLFLGGAQTQSSRRGQVEWVSAQAHFSGLDSEIISIKQSMNACLKTLIPAEGSVLGFDNRQYFRLIWLRTEKARSVPLSRGWFEDEKSKPLIGTVSHPCWKRLQPQGEAKMSEPIDSRQTGSHLVGVDARSIKARFRVLFFSLRLNSTLSDLPPVRRAAVLYFPARQTRPGSR